MPVGSWPADPKLKEVGGFAQLAALMGVEDVMLAPLRMGLGWSKERIQELAVMVRRDLKKPLIHAHVCSYAIWARKPEE